MSTYQAQRRYYATLAAEGNLPDPMPGTVGERIVRRRVEDLRRYACEERARLELKHQLGDELDTTPVREVAAAYDAIRDEMWEAEYAEPF